MSTQKLPSDGSPPASIKGTSPQEPSASAISIKLAPFYTEDQGGWFAQAEAQFGIRGVSADDMKFWYVCASLDAKTPSRVMSTMRKVDAGQHYAAIKSFLLHNFSPSQWDRTQRILSMT